MAERKQLLVGVDIGGTGIKTAVVDARGRVLGKAKRPTEKDHIQDAVEDSIGEACRAAGTRRGRLAAVGIAVAGAVDTEQGLVIEAVNLGWENYPLRKAMRRRLAMNVLIENDVRAAVWGENLLGAGRGETDLLGIWIGTGVGGGLVLNGRLYRGRHNTAGEVGRGIVLPWAPPGQGSLEQVCSRTGIVETLTRLLRSGRESLVEEICGGDLDKVGSRTLARAWKREDPLVSEVIEHAAVILGTAIGGIITLLSLGRVIVGGGLTDRLGDPWVKRVRKAAHRVVFPDRLHAVDVVRSELEDDAGPIGVALLAARATRRA